MPPIEFAFYFFRFIPPMGGRRVFTKMSQRPIESTKQLAQIWTQSNFFFWLPLAEARGGCCAGLRWAELGWAAGLTQPSPAQATEPSTTQNRPATLLKSCGSNLGSTGLSGAVQPITTKI